MSGHSKWAQIKHKKGAADAKRGVLFTKLGHAITIAARHGGGDPDMNFSLRLAMDRAKTANMPKENIERAIKRGLGTLDGVTLEEVHYEGFLPGKAAIIIECLTDSKNRTFSEIKHLVEQHGGVLSGPGSVMWLFEKKGVIEIQGKKDEEFELQTIDAGAEDLEERADKIFVFTKPENLKKVKEHLEKMNATIETADVEFVAKEKIEVNDEIGEKIQKTFEALDEHDDVSNYYTNLK